MVTKKDALALRTFHHNTNRNADGTCQRWRSNGAVKVWKSAARADDFRLPVKYGLRGYTYIDNHNADQFHAGVGLPTQRWGQQRGSCH